MSPEIYFSNNYQAARAKFLSACEAAGAEVESYKNPHTGPDGAPLFTDVCTIGMREAGTALTLCSGTHGVEGFAGSALQTGLLSDGIGSWLPDNVRLVMVHALNPYGFAYVRRVNEDNVDINRNFVDHSKPYPANHEYDRLSNLIAPIRWSPIPRAIATCKIAGFCMLRGKRTLQAAVSRGQYTHEQGLFYGGRFEVWSNQILRSIARKHLEPVSRLVFIDFHTGLGPHGHGEIILGEPKTSPMHARAFAWWGERVKSTTEGESVSAHLDGTIKIAFLRMLPNREITSVSLEFGTYPAMEVFNAMRAENWLHHHGGSTHRYAVRIKARFRRVFYPDTPEWKEAIWGQAKDVVIQALKGLSAKTETDRAL